MPLDIESQHGLALIKVNYDMPYTAIPDSMNQAFSLLALAAALAWPTNARADDAPPVTLDPYGDLRHRIEVVDQDGLPEDAFASTLRIRAGFRLGEWHGFSLQVEGEAVARIGPEDYNDTVNGKVAFPVVADPSSVQLNQAFLRWRPHEAVELAAGRRAVNLDNQRWIGSVDWRQNDQTLDLAQVTLRPLKGLTMDYFNAWRVDRIFGQDSPQGVFRDTDINAVRVAHTGSPVGTVSAYGYWLDIPSAPASSSRTLGVRMVGEQTVGKGMRVLYAAEFARQSDLGANPARFDLDYLLLEPGLALGGWTVKAGLERLEGNGTAALQTPLATLHAFNGWADKFLVTPPAGLRDLYGEVGYKFAGGALKGLTLRAIVHDFGATQTDQAYGQELNLLAVYPIRPNLTLLAKFAHYEAETFAIDTTKGWLSLQYSF
jgi:hypothetical protein